MCSTWIKRESANWVSIKGLEILEWLQITIHCCEVPNFHSIVKTARYHLCALSIYAERLHGLLVTIKHNLVGDRQCMFWAWSLFFHFLGSLREDLCFLFLFISLLSNRFLLREKHVKGRACHISFIGVTLISFLVTVLLIINFLLKHSIKPLSFEGLAHIKSLSFVLLMHFEFFLTSLSLNFVSLALI